MKKIKLPYYDEFGTLTAHVAAAILDKQCTSEIDPEDSQYIILTFDKITDAAALSKAIGLVEAEEATTAKK